MMKDRLKGDELRQDIGKGRIGDPFGLRFEVHGEWFRVRHAGFTQNYSQRLTFAGYGEKLL
jgi:hypothetical protein